MKRARAPSTSTENDNAVPTEQRDQTSQMSVQQIASLCDAIDNEAAREIASALKKSVTSNQGQLRTLCTTWGADRRDGTRELRVQELRASLQAKNSHKPAIILLCIGDKNNAAEATRNTRQAYFACKGH